MKRREYLTIAASAGVTVGAFASRGSHRDTETGGGSEDGNGENGRAGSDPTRSNDVSTLPDVDGDWDLVFEDEFDRGLLDASTWDIGWGWGRETATSPTLIIPENVRIEDDTLRLVGTHDEEGTYAGAVNTKDRVTFGPGCYFEASIRFAHRTGFQNAFWAKPNSELWPPEIDVVETWQKNDEPDDPYTTYHFLHYTDSTVPGHNVDHVSMGGTNEYEVDVSETFHTYGVEWQPDRIVHYVDGWPIIRWTNPHILTSMGTAAPFYMLLSMNIDNTGEADRSESWGEEMVIERVRLWDHVPETTDDGDQHYLWLRTADAGELATFTFRTSGGNVVLDPVEQDFGYWVTDDGTGGGGSVAARESIPGFLYDGDITAFRYNGPLEVYIDGMWVDPSTLA